MTTSNTTSGTTTFGIIDLNTGAFTPIGNQSAVFDMGIATFNGTLYGLGGSSWGDTLYSINPTTGNLTTIATMPPYAFNGFGATSSGLYAVENSGGLYSINPTTGAATFIGSTSLSTAPSEQTGLSNNSSTLYFANGSYLYTLNTTTGAATQVGYMSGSAMAALLQEGGTLYGVQILTPSGVYTLNGSTGAATYGTALTNVSGEDYVGLAPGPPSVVPEPGTLLLVGTGLAGIVGTIRRKITL
jgi:hypothetical protein